MRIELLRPAGRIGSIPEAYRAMARRGIGEKPYLGRAAFFIGEASAAAVPLARSRRCTPSLDYFFRNSTRRLLARPSGVSLEAIGLAAPSPLELRREASISNWLTSTDCTACARRLD